MFLKLLLSNYFKIKKFLKEKQDCKIYFFKVPSSIIFAFLDYDIVQTVSNRIETLKNYTEYSPEEIKKAIKLAWLIKETKNKNFKNPFQLLKKGKKYFCHPGTDRILISTYIRPKQFVKGFYIWYPNLDKNPFIFDYEFTEIKSTLNFFMNFTYSSSFEFRSTKINFNLDISDKKINSNAIFNTSKNCFIETDKNFNCLFLTYRDKMQYDKIKNMQIKDAIYFVSENLCNYGGVFFEKKKHLWTVKYD